MAPIRNDPAALRQQQERIRQQLESAQRARDALRANPQAQVSQADRNLANGLGNNLDRYVSEARNPSGPLSTGQGAVDFQNRMVSDISNNTSADRGERRAAMGVLMNHIADDSVSLGGGQGASPELQQNAQQIRDLAGQEGFLEHDDLEAYDDAVETVQSELDTSAQEGARLEMAAGNLNRIRELAANPEVRQYLDTVGESAPGLSATAPELVREYVSRKNQYQNNNDAQFLEANGVDPRLDGPVTPYLHPGVPPGESAGSESSGGIGATGSVRAAEHRSNVNRVAGSEVVRQGSTGQATTDLQGVMNAHFTSLIAKAENENNPARAEELRQAQAGLTADVDGQSGFQQGSVEALKVLQGEYGLQVDGIAGDQTQSNLFSFGELNYDVGTTRTGDGQTI